MSVVKEYYEIRSDGVKLFKTYSDKNYKIKKIGTNELYDIAVDVENVSYGYEETEHKIDSDDWGDSIGK